MKKILLDSNAYARYLSGDERAISILAQAEIVHMSVFVLGELFAGFKAGGKEKENRRQLDRFLMKSTVTVLEATKETAEAFGLIKAALKKAGTPIPINDVWVAAHALETGSELVTFDAHFLSVPGLRIWDELSR